MKHRKKIAASFLAMALLGGSVATPASAVTITDRHVLVTPGYTQYKCVHKYNFFERFVLGKKNGWYYGAHNCR